MGCHREVLVRDDDPMIDRAKTIVAIHDSLQMPRFHSLATWKSLERFIGYIPSPLVHSKYYLFASRWVFPSYMSIFCSYPDTLIELSRCDYWKSNYSDSTLVAFLNDRLSVEAALDSESIFSFVMLYNTLIDGGYEATRILNSWKDIALKEGEQLSDEFKRQIVPPVISRTESGYRIVYFIHNSSSLRLSRVVLEYADRRVTITTELLGAMGFPAIRL